MSNPGTTAEKHVKEWRKNSDNYTVQLCNQVKTQLNVLKVNMYLMNFY